MASPQRLRRKKFGELLISDGLITRQQLDEALVVQTSTGETIGEILLRENIITETDVINSICTQYGLPFLRPQVYDYDRELLDRFGPDRLYPTRVLPLQIIGDTAIIALGDIPSEAIEQAIADELQKTLFFYLSPVADIQQALAEHFSLGQDRILAYEEARRGRCRTGDSSAATAVAIPAEKGEASGDPTSSWESIFDQAEGNL